MSDTTSKALTRRPASVSSGFYRAARRAAWVMVRTITPVSYHHTERLDVDAPFIVIGNHLSLLDPIIVALPVKRYEIAFMGKKELGGNGLLKRILLNMHTIFVNRHHSDMEAMRAVMKAIREGEVLGIFPEGTRYHQGLMEGVESGAAMIALRSGVPMIPVYLTGRARLFRRIHCYVGEPIPMDDLREAGINRETCQALTERITARYRQMALEAGNDKK